MATITVPSAALPNPGDDMDAEQIRDWITNIRTFIEGTNIDETNVDLTGTDGIVGKSTAQTVTGLKSLEATAVGGGGVREVLELGVDPSAGTAEDGDGGRVVMYADDDGGTETDIARLDWVLVDASNTTEDSRVDVYTMTTGALGASLEIGYDTSGVVVNVLQTVEVAAAAVRDVLTLEWDPNDGTNLTASSSGVGLAFRMPSSTDVQVVMARVRVVGTDFTNASEDSRLDFAVITAGTLANEVQLDGTSFAPSTNDGNALGTTTLGWADFHLATGGVLNWANGEVTITETDANTLTIAGVATRLDLAAGILELNNAAEWDTGVAVVAGEYSVGRDADATNQLHLNVPTGAGFEFSVNDVAVAALVAATFTLDADLAFTGPQTISTSSGAMTIDPSTDLLLNTGLTIIGDGTTTSNAKMTIGLTIDQRGNDNEALALSSSDLAHGRTDEAATTVYGAFKKGDATGGGLLIAGFTDADATTGNRSLYFQAYTADVAFDTTKTTGGVGAGHLIAAVSNGATGVTTPGADENLFVIAAYATTRFIFDTEGSGHADVAWVAFDAYDDFALVCSIERELLALETPEQTHHRHQLESIGVIGKDSWHIENGRPRAMVNFTRLAMLHHGALIQAGDRFVQIEAELFEERNRRISLEQRLSLIEGRSRN